MQEQAPETVQEATQTDKKLCYTYPQQLTSLHLDFVSFPKGFKSQKGLKRGGERKPFVYRGTMLHMSVHGPASGVKTEQTKRQTGRGKTGGLEH